jgi:hypothetical protein
MQNLEKKPSSPEMEGLSPIRVASNILDFEAVGGLIHRTTSILDVKNKPLKLIGYSISISRKMTVSSHPTPAAPLEDGVQA